MTDTEFKVLKVRLKLSSYPIREIFRNCPCCNDPKYGPGGEPGERAVMEPGSSPEYIVVIPCKVHIEEYLRYDWKEINEINDI